MPVWKLSPLDLDDQNWEASSHRGPCIVRARSEADARATAAAAFDVRTGFRPGRGVTFPPWTRPALVKAERVENSPYATEGRTEVLEPAV